MSSELWANPVSPPFYMDAVIQPNRSLSARGVWVVLGIFAAFNVWWRSS